MDRNVLLDRLKETDLFDVIVIGGGATGLGAALDAASRGLKVVLFEQHDFTKGTSSRSTKLVHGGVRYLQSGQIRLVHEGLKERGLLLKNAPHIVRPLTFLIPSGTILNKLYLYAGIKMYDLLAGKFGIGASSSVNKTKTASLFPNLNPGVYAGGILFRDGQMDDARLGLATASTCVDHGGIVLNYMQVKNLLKKNNQVSGVQVKDTLTGNTYDISGRTVINATGVFSNNIQEMTAEGLTDQIVPSQGIHIVLERRFHQSDHGILIPKTSDGRVLFIIPWLGHVLVGTTDTLIEQPELEPLPLEEEIDFILGTLATYMVEKPERKDILSVFAGLRPLIKESGKSTKEMSREHKISVSASNLISINGGKWTAYRKMGEDVIDVAIKIGDLKAKPSGSANIPLKGADKVTTEPGFEYYGSDAQQISALIANDPQLGEKLSSALPYTFAHVKWAVEQEMALTLEDVLARRTRALFLNAKATMEAAPAVAELMAGCLNKDQKWIDDQVKDFSKLAAGYLIAD